MKFRPKLMNYGSSSMPRSNVEEACQFMVRTFPEAPAVPSLSSPLRISLDGMPCLNIDKEGTAASFDFSSGRESELVEFYDRYLSDDLEYFAISPELDSALYKLAEMFKEKPWPELKLIHFAARGPYTLGLVLKDESGAPAFYNDTMRDVIIKQLAMKARWRERKIKELFPGVQTLFRLTEAGLGVYSSAVGAGSWDDIKNALNEVMGGVEGITGIHCCANFDWSLLIKTNTDIIDFDAYQYGDTMSLYPDELKRFLERGGMIAWGIVPVTACDIENENPSSLLERLERVIQLVVDRGIDKEMLLESSWVSTACTTRPLSIELAERAYDFTKEVSQRMRKKYFG